MFYYILIALSLLFFGIGVILLLRGFLNSQNKTLDAEAKAEKAKHDLQEILRSEEALKKEGELQKQKIEGIRSEVDEKIKEKDLKLEELTQKLSNEQANDRHRKEEVAILQSELQKLKKAMEEKSNIIVRKEENM